MPLKFVTVVGARPQFIKAGPLSATLRERHCEFLVHTGQHYDPELSEIFFEQLDLPEPDLNLGIGSGSHGQQTGAMLAALEEVIRDHRPDGLIVYGDTNSTIAGALAAAKLGVPVAHIEAGLRSFNKAMPEEINRVVTDHLSRWLFAPSEAARLQLATEGIVAGVHVVGDIMLDALRLYRPRAAGHSDVVSRLQLESQKYFAATVHRAENTDDPHRLSAIVGTLGTLDREVVFPVHPRTRQRIAEFGVALPPHVRLVAPLSYLDMLELLANAEVLLTDSGGLQKEAYYLSVPCVTLRDETEWVETVKSGWNMLAGAQPDRIRSAAAAMAGFDGDHPNLYGDGQTAKRIAEVLTTSSSN
ncbi:MAG: UDP-N-acetylglucosamine 2-epimerase (non-hydrolyzing) [Chloroflexi bacterium]|nr:UDP-N-acetylglucosamine 2-epimerase (non-hydrolyzing) [Chloroflexota bacterium]